MRKFMVISIPIVTLAFFILIMLSGDFLKKPLGKDDNIPKIIEEITSDLNNENWEQVIKETEKLEAAWRKVIARIQFSGERDEINSLSMNIARLRGAITARNKSNALVELSEAYEHWEDIGK
jgi:hypothetical protein